MTSQIQADVVHTPPTNRSTKGEESRRSTRLKSLMAASALALVFALSSSAIAEDGLPPFAGSGVASVQGVDYVYPYTFPDAEVQALRRLNMWAQQNPGACITSYTKKFDWIWVTGTERTRCTITFQYCFGSPIP